MAGALGMRERFGDVFVSIAQGAPLISAKRMKAFTLTRVVVACTQDTQVSDFTVQKRKKRHGSREAAALWTKVLLTMDL